jgi:DNA adenine methylase
MKGQPASAMRGFVGFGCSFGGKFFGGYARGECRNYALESKKSLVKNIELIKKMNFSCIGYDQVKFSDRSLVYCDPPYEGTTKYSHDFDHEYFWQWARELSKSHIVLISEYSAPSDFTRVWESSHTVSIRTSQGAAVRREGIFKWNT